MLQCGAGMACDSTRPLSLREAKARLSEALENASPAGLVRRHPLSALSLAVAGGFVAAHLKGPSVAKFLHAQRLILPFLLGISGRR